MVTSESLPFVKTGGLGDVSFSLTKALNKLGIQVDLILPLYGFINIKDTKKIGEFNIFMGKKFPVELFSKKISGIRFIFVSSPVHFNRKGVYGEAKEYKDNWERFGIFSKAAADFANREKYHILHANDWQSALSLLYLRKMKSPVSRFFTIHNISYQGNFPAWTSRPLGLEEEFHPEGVEFFGKLSFLKAGIVYSEIITTVSPTHSREILTPEFGFGMEGILRKRRNDLFGVLNGIDTEVWNPKNDPLIRCSYSTENLSGKEKCKEELIKKAKIKFSPLIAMISRIAPQKGFDLLIKSLEKILALRISMIILGRGENSMLGKLKEWEKKNQQAMRVFNVFDEELAHQIIAGADIYLMPSKFEPCGLTQMYALRYGTVPVVRAVGGLNDTVDDFKFERYQSEALAETLGRAVKTFRNDKKKWENLIKKGMSRDFSWLKSAGEYVKLYQISMIRRRLWNL